MYSVLWYETELGFHNAGVKAFRILISDSDPAADGEELGDHIDIG